MTNLAIATIDANAAKKSAAQEKAEGDMWDQALAFG
jgi:hypothetical protein